MISALLPLVGYLLLTLGLAVWSQKRARSGSPSNIVEEYFIGGRSMGGFVLAMTVIASYTSASSFVGGPGVAYSIGLAWVLLAMIQVPTTFLTLGVFSTLDTRVMLSSSSVLWLFSSFLRLPWWPSS